MKFDLNFAELMGDALCSDMVTIVLSDGNAINSIMKPYSGNYIFSGMLEYNNINKLKAEISGIMKTKNSLGLSCPIVR